MPMAPDVDGDDWSEFTMVVSKRTAITFLMVFVAWFAVVVVHVAADSFRGECSLDGTGRPVTPLGPGEIELLPPRSICRYVDQFGVTTVEIRPWSNDAVRWLVLLMPPAAVGTAVVRSRSAQQPTRRRVAGRRLATVPAYVFP